MPSILFVSPMDLVPSGFQVQAQTLRSYRDAGWEVMFAVMRPPGDTHANDNYGGTLQIDGISVYRWQLPDSLSTRMLWASSITSQLDWAFRLGQALRRSSFSVRTIDVAYATDFIGVAACRMSGVVDPCCVKVHRFFGVAQPQLALAASRRRRTVSRAVLHQWALNAPCDLLVMTNDGTLGDQVVRRHAPQNAAKMLFLPNGVDVPGWCDAQIRVRDAGAEPLKIVMASRLVRWKRVHLGMHAMAIARDRGLAFRARVIGDGPEGPALRQLVRELRLESRVEFMGAVANDEVWRHYLWADVLVSCYDWSNVGNPLFEALSAGLPVVTVDNGGTREWIAHRENGLLCQPDETRISECIAGTLHELQGEPGLLRTLSAGALACAKSRIWSWAERMRYEIGVVEDALRRKRALRGAMR